MGSCLFCGKPLNKKGRKFCSREHFCRWREKEHKNPFWRGGSRVHKICQECGKEFEVYPSQSGRKFCSIECYRKHEKGRQPWNKGLKGYTNGGTFKKGHTPWNKGLTKDMNKKLAEAARKMSKSKKLLVDNGWKPWNVGYGEYIAGEKNPRWNGGKNGYRGPNWHIQRAKALERDGYRCQKCGKSESEVRPAKLEVHHIIPFDKYGVERYEEANKLENLVTLCTSCHIREEVMAWRSGL